MPPKRPIDETCAAAAALLNSWGSFQEGFNAESLSAVLRRYADHRLYTRGKNLYSHLINCEGDKSLKPPGRGTPAELLTHFLASTSQLSHGSDDSGLRLSFKEMAAAYHRRTGQFAEYDHNLTARENINQLMALDVIGEKRATQG